MDADRSKPEQEGWWSVDVPEAEHGADYAFLLGDDATEYPDPRSPWQPNGVHAASRVLDHSRYQWRDSDWQPPAFSSAVIYELHVGTFTQEGTFASAVRRLSALRELGITHVELLPVASYTGRWGWGYDGVSLYAPQECYGGPEELKRFVDACHEAGLAVLLDVVYNHFGPVGNYTGRFGPYLTESHRTPWGGAVNLEEAGSYAVRRFFCENAIQWLRDYHFDGLRLDAVHALVDRSAKHFLEQLAEEVDALSAGLGRNLVLIAESDLNDPRVVTPRAEHGYGMTAQWSDDFHHAVFAYLTGERGTYYADFGSLAQIAKSLQSAYVYDGIYSPFRRRIHGRPIGDLNAHRFLGYIQNHDQIGNRARGERLHHIAGVRRARLAAALMMTSPFVPMLFQGEEFAASAPFLYFADHDDPELARAVSEGRRKEHAADDNWGEVPDPEAEETYRKSQLDWKEAELPIHAEMLDWYRSLIQLRRRHAELHNADFSAIHVRFSEEDRWLVMERGVLHVYFNFNERAFKVDVAGEARILLASDVEAQCSLGKLLMPRESVVILVTGLTK